MTATDHDDRCDDHDDRDDCDDHDDFGGFARDLPHLLGRRRALQLLGVAGLSGLVAACGSSSQSATSTTVADTSTTAADGAASPSSSTTTSTSGAPTSAGTDSGDVVASAGAEIPDETQGPYPADGSNGPNVLGESGVVRADLTTSFGSLSGTAEGVPIDIRLTVVDAATGSPLPGAAVYLWHCTADGRYSIYEVSDQNYLRGVQAADDAGRVTFTSVFPGCYAGRWPHCHFEVYTGIDEATAGSQAVKTSQLALPEADCATVYADARYGSSAGNLARLSLDTDNVFRDGWADQLATVSGSGGEGYAANLLVRV